MNNKSKHIVDNKHTINEKLCNTSIDILTNQTKCNNKNSTSNTTIDDIIKTCPSNSRVMKISTNFTYENRKYKTNQIYTVERNHVFFNEHWMIKRMNYFTFLN